MRILSRLPLLIGLTACCGESVRYDADKNEFVLPAPLSIGWETNNGGVYIRRIPQDDWGYALAVNILGPHASTTKAIAVSTDTETEYSIDLFAVYGDGRGYAAGPFEFKAPITVKEIYAGDRQIRWPDYVFSEGYALRSLYELEAYIKKHRRLPGLPAAEEVSRQGLPLIGTQKALVEKVEELTLYVIQLQHQVDSLKSLLRTCR